MSIAQDRARERDPSHDDWAYACSCRPLGKGTSGCWRASFAELGSHFRISAEEIFTGETLVDADTCFFRTATDADLNDCLAQFLFLIGPLGWFGPCRRDGPALEHDL